MRRVWAALKHRQARFRKMLRDDAQTVAAPEREEIEPSSRPLLVTTPLGHTIYCIDIGQGSGV